MRGDTVEVFGKIGKIGGHVFDKKGWNWEYYVYPYVYPIPEYDIIKKFGGGKAFKYLPSIFIQLKKSQMKEEREENMRYLVIYNELPRYASEFLHEDCGGIYERVECSKEEMKDFNCNRLYECCARAFVCNKCKNRLAMRVESPEME